MEAILNSDIHLLDFVYIANDSIPPTLDKFCFPFDVCKKDREKELLHNTCFVNTSIHIPDSKEITDDFSVFYSWISDISSI